MSETPAQAPIVAGRRRWRWIAGAAVIVVGIGLGLCEAAGWPFLAAPLQRWLGTTLDRPVEFGSGDGAPRVRLLGSIRVDAASIRIGAPAWSRAPQFLAAREAHLSLAYADLWSASRGKTLRIRELRAAHLDIDLERLADGRASWQFGPPRDASQPAPRVPTFGRLQVESGTLSYRDAPLAADLRATFSLDEGQAAGLRFDANGSYRRQPLTIALKTIGVLPVVADAAGTPPLPLSLEARLGGARLRFDGSATDAVHLGALTGRFTVQGPSLAAAAEPLRVTLPTTGPFRVQGSVVKQGVVWNVVADAATIGSSQLRGAFQYDPRPAVPMLAGRLGGSRLLLADLGPAVGAPTPKAADTPTPKAPDAPRSNATPARVLPDRPFDLPSLRAMNANVLVDIDNLDLGSTLLEPLRPLRTHLVLADGVLTLRDLDARTAQGRLAGNVKLDGRNAQALWTADLNWADVRLERWLHLDRQDGAPPYVAGRLAGHAQVAGQGRSTAAILGSLNGDVRMRLTDGTISHLAVEAAGLDLAQGLGLLIKGDDALPVRCGVADLAVERGVAKPRVLVLDTPDSTVWIDGNVSLASEAMDLRAVVAPKDFSPLALRTPLRVRGQLGAPQVALDTQRLAPRLGAAALLAFVNPLAALIPLIDTGDAAETAPGCRALTQRAKG